MQSVVLLLLVASQCSAAVAFVQSASAVTASGATNLSVAFTADNTAGCLLVATAQVDPASNVAGITDTQGNTWSIAYSTVDIADFGQRAFWYAPNCKAGPNTVTVTNTGTGQDYTTLGIAEFSGFSPNAQPDQSSEQSSTGDNWDSGSKTTLADGELIIGQGTGSTVPVVSGSGFTQMENIDGDNWEYMVQPTKGSVSARFTTATTGDTHFAYMVTFFENAPVRHRVVIR